MFNAEVLMLFFAVSFYLNSSGSVCGQKIIVVFSVETNESQKCERNTWELENIVFEQWKMTESLWMIQWRWILHEHPFEGSSE